jgi:hypothetical protein
MSVARYFALGFGVDAFGVVGLDAADGEVASPDFVQPNKKQEFAANNKTNIRHEIFIKSSNIIKK